MLKILLIQLIFSIMAGYWPQPKTMKIFLFENQEHWQFKSKFNTSFYGHLCRTIFNNISSFTVSTAQKIKFSVKDFYSKCDQIRSFLADLVTFTEETLNPFCTVKSSNFDSDWVLNAPLKYVTQPQSGWRYFYTTSPLMLVFS